MIGSQACNRPKKLPFHDTPINRTKDGRKLMQINFHFMMENEYIKNC